MTHVLKIQLFLILISISVSGWATNGYFQIGYGPNARALTGAVTALPQDRMAAATNPAGMALVSGGLDFSLELFSPLRSASAVAGSTDSDSNIFFVPNFGYVKKSNSNSFGITVYANGGMNTDYPANLPGSVNFFGAPGELGVNLQQLIIAPTYALTKDKHSFGASLLLAYQTFEAKGISPFAGFTPSGTTNNLTNRGTDSAIGYGLRVGWIGKFEKVQLGAAYATRVYMKEFDKYNELFAEQGDFDIPANWSLGIAYMHNDKLTFVTDVQGIQYGDVASIANPGPTTNGAPFADGQGLLGQDNGLGFGWDNMIILKVGALYKHNDKMTFRFGVSHGKQPIDNTQVTFNILAPAVVETHLALGLSYKLDNLQINATYNRAMNNKVSGDFPLAFGGTPGANEVTLEMEQNTLDFGVSWNF